jgi:MYXO-CTERM domain-containing protein
MRERLLTGVIASVAIFAASPAGAVRRCDILPHAVQWVNARVMYSQGPYGGYCPGSYYCDPAAGGACYRPDCSGFVSAMWGLPAPGHTTYYFAGGPYNDGVSHVIGASELLPGDALNFGGDPAAGTGHIMLFGGWLGGSRFWAYEESSCGTPAHYSEHDLSTMPEFTPIRFNNVTDCPPPCAAAGAACTKQSDCCTGATCENGVCVGCPSDQGNGCTWNGCSGAPMCSISVDAQTPTALTVVIYNQTGTAWPADHTVLGSASGADSALAAQGWLSSSLAVHPTGDTAPSAAATFVLPLYLSSAAGVTQIAESFDVFIDGKAIGAQLPVQVLGNGAGGYDAAVAELQMPPMVAPGERMQVTVNLTNVGGRPWLARRVVLAMVGGDGTQMRDPSWPGADEMAQLASDVAPGQTAQLSFWLNIPSGSDGVMHPVVQLRDSDVGPFGPRVDVPVTIESGGAVGGCSVGGRPAPLGAALALAALALMMRRRRK